MSFEQLISKCATGSNKPIMSFGITHSHVIAISWFDKWEFKVNNDRWQKIVLGLECVDKHTNKYANE